MCLITSAFTIKGGVSYTVETARTEAFSNIPLSINISDYASYFSDYNYIANKNVMNKNKVKIRDRYITFFLIKLMRFIIKKINLCNFTMILMGN